MNQRVGEILDLISQLIISVVIIVTPLLIWNLTTEYYETPKFLFMLVVTLALLVIWAIRSLVIGKVTITRTPLDIPLLLILVVTAVSSFFSAARSQAILGNLPRINDSLVSIVVYILFYFALVWNLRHSNFAKRAIYLIIFSGVILSILSLLSYAGINFLGLSIAQSLNFTPTGTSFSTVTILVLSLPIILLGIIGTSKNEVIAEAIKEDFVNNSATAKLALSAILTLFGIVIVLTGSTAGLLGSLAAIIIVLLISPTAAIKKSLPFLITPTFILILVALVSYIQIGGSNNLLYAQAQNFPREIQIPFSTSWKVSVSAFRDSPFWGTGPGSYLNDFTVYKPIEFNTFKFWNVRFDQAYNEYLQFLGTLGISGLIALALMMIVFVSVALKRLSAQTGSIQKGLAVSGLSFFVILAFHPSSLVAWVFGLIILALFMLTDKNVSEELEVGITASKKDAQQFTLRFDTLPVIILLIVAGVTIATVYFGSQYFLADYHHRQALNAVAANDGLTAYNELVQSERLNPYADLYRLDLAQTNFALANAIAAQKGPTEASPAGSLTDSDKQNIQTLLSQAIAEGKVAVALNPRSANNLEILGSIYRQISGVAQNALSFALDSYGLAIQRDPLNPLLRLTVGGIYYSAKSYDMAIRFFTDTINLKPDYANGYYNLAIALRDSGDLADAVTIAEKTVSLLDPKSADYKTASDLLADIRKQAQATLSAQPGEASATATTPPAAQTNSALNNQNLPNVLDLPKPENIATPPAVKVSPTVSPTPTTKATPTP